MAPPVVPPGLDPSQGLHPGLKSGAIISGSPIYDAHCSRGLPRTTSIRDPVDSGRRQPSRDSVMEFASPLALWNLDLGAEPASTPSREICALRSPTTNYTPSYPPTHNSQGRAPPRQSPLPCGRFTRSAPRHRRLALSLPQPDRRRAEHQTSRQRGFLRFWNRRNIATRDAPTV